MVRGDLLNQRRFAQKTRQLYRSLILGIAELCVASVLCAEDLAPRAYVITPLQANAITITYSYYRGNVLLDGTAPITGATASTAFPSLLFITHQTLPGAQPMWLWGFPMALAILKERSWARRGAPTARD
jgi:hypothetical protein